MISFIRRFLSSWVVLGLLGLIMVAFVVTGVNTPGFGSSTGVGGDGVAKVGRITIGEAEIERRVKVALDAQRQQNPALDIAAFVRGGGVEQVIEQVINGRAIDEFGRRHGLVISKRLVDGAIAGIPAFNGPTGQFDRAIFLQVLQQRGINEKELRDDFAREALTRQLLSPVSAAARVPNQLARPYAALLVQSRAGRYVTVPSAAFVPAGPVAEADLQRFYQSNIAAYTVPERRQVRYAAFDRARFEGRVAATEAEIAADYQAKRAQYAGRETRAFTQAVVADQAQAQAVYQRVRGGASFDDALRPLGLQAQVQPGTDKPSYARATSAAIADAAFAAPVGTVLAPVRTALGFTIVRVDKVDRIAGKTLEQARGESAQRLTAAKVEQALADLVGKIEDEVNEGASFDDTVRANGLTVSIAPPVTATGVDPDQATFKPAPELTAALQDAFAAEPDDDAAVAQAGPGRYVLWDLERVVPPSPRPLQQIRDRVLADYRTTTGLDRAKRVADGITAQVNRGRTLEEALAASGARLSAPQPLGGRRIDVTQNSANLPAPLVALFDMVPGKARALQGRGGEGFAVVVLDRVIDGPPAEAERALALAQGPLRSLLADEYVQQFVAAIRAEVGVTRDETKLAALKRRLLGGQ